MPQMKARIAPSVMPATRRGSTPAVIVMRESDVEWLWTLGAARFSEATERDGVARRQARAHPRSSPGSSGVTRGGPRRCRARSTHRKRLARHGGRRTSGASSSIARSLEQREVEHARNRPRRRCCALLRRFEAHPARGSCCGESAGWRRPLPLGDRKIIERADRFVTGLNGQVERRRVSGQRELIAAVAAAIRAVEADVLALGTLHRGRCSSAEEGAEPAAARPAASSAVWISARSRSASGAPLVAGPDGIEGGEGVEKMSAIFLRMAPGRATRRPWEGDGNGFVVGSHRGMRADAGRRPAARRRSRARKMPSTIATAVGANTAPRHGPFEPGSACDCFAGLRLSPGPSRHGFDAGHPCALRRPRVGPAWPAAPWPHRCPRRARPRGQQPPGDLRLSALERLSPGLHQFLARRCRSDIAPRARSMYARARAWPRSRKRDTGPYIDCEVWPAK